MRRVSAGVRCEIFHCVQNDKGDEENCRPTRRKKPIGIFRKAYVDEENCRAAIFGDDKVSGAVYGSMA